jgi:cytochrome d ubiquinol oxidase subunit I
VGSYVALEAGWVTTEVGRQPWIVHNLMRVSDAVNPAIDSAYIWIMFSALLVVYAVIAFFFITILLRLSAGWRQEDSAPPGEEEVAPEEAVPYGPSPA